MSRSRAGWFRRDGIENPVAVGIDSTEVGQRVHRAEPVLFATDQDRVGITVVVDVEHRVGLVSVAVVVDRRAIAGRVLGGPVAVGPLDLG